MKNITETIEVSESQELMVAAKENNLPAEAAESLLSIFSPMAKQAHEIILQSENITDAKLARAHRLKLREVRINIEAARKTAKEDSLRTGKAIDGMANILKYLIEPVETRLSDVENAEELKAAAARAALKVERAAQLTPFGVDPAFYSLDVMPEETWIQLLDNSRIAHEAKIAAAKAAEEARIKAENDRLKEEARIREENAKLKAEADAREAQLKIEREAAAKEAKRLADAAASELAEVERKAEADRKTAAKVAQEAADKARKEREAIEAKAAAERLAREKLEAAERARIAAAEQAAKVEAEAKAKAERAPDKEKIRAWLDAIGAIPLPELSTAAGRAAARTINTALAQFGAVVELEISKL